MSQDNRTVAHLWANQSKPKARSSNGNFSYDGDTIYSYSTAIARLILGADGKPIACLRTNRSYSNTTSGKHEPAISHALRGDLPVIHVSSIGEYGISPDHADNLNYLASSVKNGADSARRALTNIEYHWEDVQRAVTAGNTYRAVFNKLDHAEFVMPEGWQDDMTKARERAYKRDNPDPASADRRERERARRMQRKQEQEAERARIAILTMADKIEEWRAGIGYGLPWGAPLCLRIQPNNPDVLETSKGAKVPLCAAKHVFAKAAECQAIGHGFVPAAPFRVGDFRLDRIDDDGTIHAGCHTIPWEESARLAVTLGLLEPTTV